MMKKLINQLKEGTPKDVLVIGDVMLDEYSFGSVSRISPEAPVPVVREERVEHCLGGAANVAANCKHIGFNVNVIGLIGEGDVAGCTFLSMIKGLGISTEGIIKSKERCTTCKKRIISQNFQMLRLDAEVVEPLSKSEYDRIVERIDTLLKPSSIVMISDYAKGVITQPLMKYLCQISRDRGCMVMVDPKGPDFSKYKDVDYIKPNMNEFNKMTHFFGLDSDLSFEEKGRVLCQLLSLKGLIVTLGDEGIIYISPDSCITSPACRREVFDLTGAGDTVFAFLALCFANGVSIEESLELANYAASVAVSHLKTYAVSLEELIEREDEPSDKIYHNWARLKTEVEWLRAEGRKIVFTNGCFDILHPGHIHVLSEAKRKGDVLVVAINTDDSVKRFKGPQRPVNSLEHRITLVSAIGFVNFVVSFDQDTPRELIEYLKPDVLVKGGDYQPQKVAGYDAMVSYGGSVEIVDFLPGFSTTSIIDSIKRGVGVENNEKQREE